MRDGGWLVVEDLHASFMDEFGNPSPHSTVRFLDDLADDLHRRHPRSNVAPHHPNLAAVVDHMVIGTSWAGLRIARSRLDAMDEISHGDDDSLMDYDHRWDDSLRGLGARGPFLGALRNRYTGKLAWRSRRRLFRGDAGPQ